MKIIIAILIATLTSQADILVGPKPCLWKKAVVETVPDGMVMDSIFPRGHYYFGPGKHDHEKCKRNFFFHSRPSLRKDTTWERYWDECPKGKK